MAQVGTSHGVDATALLRRNAEPAQCKGLDPRGPRRPRAVARRCVRRGDWRRRARRRPEATKLPHATSSAPSKPGVQGHVEAEVPERLVICSTFPSNDGGTTDPLDWELLPACVRSDRLSPRWAATGPAESEPVGSTGEPCSPAPPSDLRPGVQRLGAALPHYWHAPAATVAPNPRVLACRHSSARQAPGDR